MRHFQRLAVVAFAAVMLASCATITAVPAGPLQMKGGYAVTLDRMWSDVSIMYPLRGKKVRVLSLDGPTLNQLYLTDGLAPGESLMRSPVKERPTPVYRAGMSVTERMEFVVDSIAALGYTGVASSNPRPGKFGAHNAVRFDLTAQTSAGLDMRATALAAEIDGKLFLIVYVAPAEHYYDASLPEIERIMASVRI